MIACALPMVCSAADSVNVKNWSSSSSGKATIAADEATKSVKVAVCFSKDKKDRWAYPRLKLDEADLGASKLSFEIKVESEPKQANYKNCFIMLTPADKKVKRIWLPFKLKNTDDFQTITIDLKKAPKYKNAVQIGLNFVKADTATLYIRNVKFTK